MPPELRQNDEAWAADIDTALKLLKNETLTKEELCWVSSVLTELKELYYETVIAV